jgi:hypothetical protein
MKPELQLDKKRSHGRIGEAATAAKCWMHGIPAYFTGGLRPNFAGSDLIVDTEDPRSKLWIQVKSGYCGRDQVYLTQCSGEHELTEDKFVADFVVFVNIERKAGQSHQHDGKLDFEHLTFFVVPRDDANKIYRNAVCRERARPLKNGGIRKLGNLAVYVPLQEMTEYRNAWLLLRGKTKRPERS